MPTSTETPTERGSVNRCDGQDVNRGNWSGCRAAPGGRPGAPLPRVRGPLDKADRRPYRPLARDGQGVLLRPDGEKARAVKARSVGVCRGCGAYTQPRNGKGDAYAYCKACHPGAIARRWTAERVLDAMSDWRSRYGGLPSSYDWSRTNARRRGGEAVARLAEGEWPAASVVTRQFGTWSAARAVAAQRAREMTREPASASSSFGRESISLPKPRESTAISADLRGGEPKPEPIDLQVLRTTLPDFAHNSGR